MKVRLERDTLSAAVAWAARQLPAKAQLPILSGLMLTAESDGLMADGTLSLAAFDYEVSGRTEVAADVMEPGRALVGGRLLSEIVKSLPGRPVEITTEGTRVRLTCGASKFTLLTMPLDDYPSLPVMPAGSGMISGDLFSTAVAQVAVAASKDGTPPMLAGVRVEISGDQITMMATDKYRLAERTIPWRPTDPNVQAGALVRAFTLSEIARSVAGGTDLTVGVGDNLIGFESAGRRTTSLLMDGEYPKVRALFPVEFEGHVVVNQTELIDAVKRVGLVADRNTPIRLAATDGGIVLDSGSGEDATASEGLAAIVAGPDIEQGFNVPYLVDGLSSIGGPWVRISYTKVGKPVVLSGQSAEDGEPDGDYRYLLMPMRL
jgi:DNA polymerase-3 subunit beta